MWRAYTSISQQAWDDANGMPGAQVAVADYRPAGWPEETYTIVRRVRVDAEEMCFPMVPAGASNDEIIVAPNRRPYDDAAPLDDQAPPVREAVS